MKPTFRLLVTGSRDYTDRNRVGRYIEWVEQEHAHYFSWERGAGFVLVHGDARGLDTIAARIAAGRKDWKVEAHPANWRALGSAAGSVRNTVMVEAGADLCLAFPLPGSRGTWDCVQKAFAAGIPVKVVELP